VIDATGVALEWDVRQIDDGSGDSLAQGPLPKEVLEAIRKNRVALKGPLTTLVGGSRSVNVALRRSLDLYAQVRPCKTYRGARSLYGRVDLVVIRETTEDLYAGIEFERGAERTNELVDWLLDAGCEGVSPGSAISIKPISEPAARRIFLFAFNYARRNRRKRVTCVHKATVMRYTDGLFLDAASEVAAGFPEIEFNHRTVDTVAVELVQHPEFFDVLVMPNLYGDIISELGAGLIGGVGLAPGGNFGDDVAVFEPGHGSAPKYAGLNRVNPIATMLSGVMMLRHLGDGEAADRLEGAIAAVVEEGNFVTYDQKPTRNDPTAVGTQEVADAIVGKLGTG
jgi:isocitrate dehydrogenase (NAD+)